MKKMFVVLMTLGVLMTFNACDGTDSSEPLVEVAKKTNAYAFTPLSMLTITALDNDIQILGVVGNRGNLTIKDCGEKTLQFGERETCYYHGSVEQLREVQVKTNKGTWTFTW